MWWLRTDNFYEDDPETMGRPVCRIASEEAGKRADARLGRRGNLD